MVMNKKIIIFIIFFFIIVFGIIFLTTKRETLVCNKTIKNKAYIEQVEVIIYYNNKIKKYTLNKKYDYKEGFMDDVVDKYDNLNAYLNIINKKDGITSNIKQEGYILEYNVNILIDKAKKEDYKLLEIEDVIKVDKLKDIRKHYEDLGYVCK